MGLKIFYKVYFFVRFHYNELQKSWDYLRTEDEMKNCENVSGPKWAGIELLLSSNLLKQTLLYKG